MLGWFATALLAAGSALAEEPGATQLMVRPDAVVWGPPPAKLPPGARFSVLLGDPAVPGELYVFRAKLPDGYSVPPHIHPMDEHVTVVAGTMLLGFGSARDDEKLEELPTGSYVTLPQGVPHYNRMRGETVLQFHGIGPFDITYLDPNDDPTQQAP